MSVNTQLQDLKIEVASHKATVNEWIKGTNEYRITLCNKVEDIRTALARLPCSERKGWYVSIDKQVAWMWKVVAILLVAVLGFLSKGVAERSEINKDIEQIKIIASRIEKEVK